MKRLTKRIDGKAAFYECTGTCGSCAGVLCGSVFLMADRLAAYEDTGLEPKEIIDLQQAWDMYGGELGITEILSENHELKEKRTPKCYSADVDGGCRYLVPDGDDEPIDRCKRCPLCYGDKQRKQSKPNPPPDPGGAAGDGWGAGAGGPTRI